MRVESRTAEKDTLNSENSTERDESDQKSCGTRSLTDVNGLVNVKKANEV